MIGQRQAEIAQPDQATGALCGHRPGPASACSSHARPLRHAPLSRQTRLSEPASRNPRKASFASASVQFNTGLEVLLLLFEQTLPGRRFPCQRGWGIALGQINKVAGVARRIASSSPSFSSFSSKNRRSRLCNE